MSPFSDVSNKLSVSVVGIKALCCVTFEVETCLIYWSKETNAYIRKID